jgi:hypothetical protein
MRTMLGERRHPRTPSRLALALALTVGTAACDDSSSIDAVLAPSALSGSVAGGSAGGLAVAGPTQVSLVGSWTRITHAGAVLTEQTWTFASDGSGARATIARSPLGAPLTVEQQPFAWDAGGGILLLRFRGVGAPATTVRAAYGLRTELTRTVLRLDGLDYVRTGG